MSTNAAIDVDDETRRKHELRIRAALRLADLPIETACRHMGPINQAQLTRQFQGEGHLSYTRLTMLPRLFWQWHGLLTIEEEGLPPEVRRAARTFLALLRRRQRKTRRASSAGRDAR